MAPLYNRKAELKAFDDTKAGVKGLVDNGITKIPQIFVEPPENTIQSSPPTALTLDIPVIDLKNIENDAIRRKSIVEEIRVASKTWGFFQLINHGIDVSVLDEMVAGVKRFHEEAQEVKAEFYTRDTNKTRVMYYCNFSLYQSPVANWRDTFYAHLLPDFLDPQELPLACRDIFMEYSKLVMELGTKLLELLSEALGLSSNHLNDMDCGEGLGIAGHYYPACPEPELTLGATKHSDNDFLTVLLQDQIGGLQVLYQNHWLDCEVARTLWNRLRTAFNSSVWDTTSVNSVFTSWKADKLTTVGKIVWGMLLHAGIWEIWKERNRRIFEEKEMTTANLVDRVKNTIWRWSAGFTDMKFVFLDCFLNNWEPIVTVIG